MGMIKYRSFYEAFVNKDKEKSIELISSYIKRKTGVDLYPYNEIFHIQKGDLFLDGQLFISLKTSKAIRINWVKDDIRSEIHSIDMWVNFDFDSNPEYTLELNNNSVAGSLSEIVKFFNDPRQYIVYSGKKHAEITEIYDPQEELEDVEKKLSRARSPKSRELLQRRSEELKVIIAQSERSELDSDKIKQDDLDIDVFRAIELNTMQVAKGKSNSLIITGMAGVGKSQTVKDTLKSIGMVSDVHYYWATGTVTTAGLYDILFKHRNGIVVFDDSDAVFKDADSINLLKGALDTYDVREISKLTKGNTFDSAGMSDEEIQERYDRDPSKLPNKFQFKGRVIFISNLPEEKFDDALISRSLHVDVHLSKSEVIERMRDIMKKLAPELPNDIKEEALEYLVYITDNYPVKFDLNIRTLIHSINLRAGNDQFIKIGDREEVAWKLLIKKYLVKTKRKK